MIIDLSKTTKRHRVEKQDVFSIDHDDWMREYELDKASGNIILISDPNIIKNGMKPNSESLFNSRFNIPTDLDEKVIPYACDCSKLIGKYNEGQICPECSSIVSIRYSVELLRRGWIDLGEFQIIIPAMYSKIKAYIGGRTTFEDMLKVDTSVQFVYDPAHPFRGIGLYEFSNRYIEILDYFKKTTTKPELYKILVDRANITFSSKIYVMSSAHRPGYVSSKNKSFSFHNINVLFVKILTDLNLVKRGRRSGRKAIEIIGNIQSYLMRIHDLSIMKLRGKERLIRSNIISSRLCYTSRMVIIAETEHDNIDSTRVSYKAFLVMFELEIINAMMRGHGNVNFAKMTSSECLIYIRECKFTNVVDPDIYKICMMLIKNRKDDGVYVLVGRNPSFDLGSLQMLHVVDLFPNAEDYILTIQHNSLREYSGDYDGDVLNVYSPKERCVIDALKDGFMPSKLILDRTGGYYNSNMVPIKDEFAFIKSFCDSEYKPIDPDDVELEKVEDIMKKIINPFDYKSIDFEKQFKIFVDSVNSSSFKMSDYDIDPQDIIDFKSNKSPEIYTDVGFLDYSVDGEDTLCYDPFTAIDRDQFYPCPIAG